MRCSGLPWNRYRYPHKLMRCHPPLQDTSGQLNVRFYVNAGLYVGTIGFLPFQLTCLACHARSYWPFSYHIVSSKVPILLTIHGNFESLQLLACSFKWQKFKGSWILDENAAWKCLPVRSYRPSKLPYIASCRVHKFFWDTLYYSDVTQYNRLAATVAHFTVFPMFKDIGGKKVFLKDQ